MRATAGQLARGLSVSFSRYRLQGGRIAFANTSPPELPVDVAGDVQDITGLDDLFQVQSGALRASPAPKPGDAAVGAPQVVTGGPQPCSAASAASSVGAYTADQIGSAYGFSALYGQGDEGQGQSVAVIEAEPNLASDIAAYQSCYGTNTSVNYVSVDGGPGAAAPGSGEAALDIEQIIGLAPKADVVVYQSPATLDNIYDSFSTAITTDTSRVISTSWGTCEGFASNNPDISGGVNNYFAALFNAENTLFEQAAAQGQSVVAASGDDGSEGCDEWQGNYAGLSSQLDVQDPSAQPFVTGVGGTTLSDPSAPSSETVWNSYHAGGGGISAQWPMPTYQADAPPGVGVINTRSSGTPCEVATGDCREVPDVSADADPYTGYAVFWDGAWYSYGGTSAGAPLWAALLTLTDASRACGGKPVGFANPDLYATAAHDPSTFHDITSGNNDYTGENAGTYPATPGYDMASGLGTPTANLAPALCDAPVPGGPQITSASSALVGLGSPATVTVTTSGSSTSAITESGVLPAGMDFTDNGNGTATIGGTPSQIGNFPLVLTATNATSSVTQSFILSVGTAPAITSVGPATFTAGAPGSFTMTTTGTPTPSFTVAGALPSGLVLSSTGELTGTPATTAAGIYPVTVTASNGLSAATQAFSVVVNGTPSFASAETAPFVLDAPGSFTVLTSAAPAPALTDSGVLPAGLAFVDNGNGTATISGTPTTPGTSTITIEAANSYGTATQSLSLEVLASVQGPAFTSPGNATFVVMQPGTFQFTATGSPAPTFSVVSGSLPEGISQSYSLLSGISVTSDGLLSGTPYWGTGGTYHIVVEASNGVGAPAVQSFTLTVDDYPRLAASSYDGSFMEGPVTSTSDLVLGQPGALVLRTTGFPSPSLTEGGQLPPGTSFVDNGNGTATIGGTPTQSGSFPIIVVANNGLGPEPDAYPPSNIETIDLTVAHAVAPSFLSPDTASVPTASPCGAFETVASGFPTPKISETGSLPASESVADTTSSTDWDPGVAIIGNTGCEAESGTYPLTFTASNSAGSATQDLALTLSSGSGTKPTFTSSNSTTFYTDKYNAFLARVSEASYGCPLNVAGGNLPSGVAMDDWGLLSGVPSAGSEGSYPVTISCVLGGKTYATQSFTLNVTAGPPTITSPSSTAFALGENGSFAITTDGAAALSISESGALPPGTTFIDNGNGTATISGVPTQVGSYPVTISAANSLGTATQRITVSVGTAESPEFTSASSTTVYAQEEDYFQLGASSIPPPTFSLASGSLPPGLTLSGDGVISGTASAPGTYPVVVEASNGVSPDATQDLLISAIQAPEFTNISEGTFDYTYSGGPPISIPIDASGYPVPSISASGLPPGLSFVDDGPVPGNSALSSAIISGTPSLAGTFTTTILASSSLGTQVSTYIFNVSFPLVITTTSLPDAELHTPYSQQLTTTGGKGSIVWKKISLPKGFALSSTGLLTGTPTSAGQFSVGVSVSSAGGTPVGASLPLTVVAAPAFGKKSPTSATFEDGVAGSTAVTATGYPAPTFSETGSLPSGVTLNPTTGVLSGTPALTSQSATYDITIIAANGIAPSASEPFTLTVMVPLAITTSTLPGATRGVSFDGAGFQLQASGGIGPYKWKSVGTLPTGLKLSSTGVLSGTPNATLTPGTYPIDVEVTVKEGKTTVSVSQTLTLQIS